MWVVTVPAHRGDVISAQSTPLNSSSLCCSTSADNSCQCPPPCLLYRRGARQVRGREARVCGIPWWLVTQNGPLPQMAFQAQGGEKQQQQWQGV